MFRLNWLIPEATGSGSRLEPRNVNGHPWSRSLGQDFRLSPKFDVGWKYYKFLCKHLFEFQSQPYKLRLYNCLPACSQKICGQANQWERKFCLCCIFTAGEVREGSTDDFSGKREFSSECFMERILQYLLKLKHLNLNIKWSLIE